VTTDLASVGPRLPDGGSKVTSEAVPAIARRTSCCMNYGSLAALSW
jgi:hypothetical protein